MELAHDVFNTLLLSSLVGLGILLVLLGRNISQALQLAAGKLDKADQAREEIHGHALTATLVALRSDAAAKYRLADKSHDSADIAAAAAAGIAMKHAEQLLIEHNRRQQI